jgi:hypothetical protein
MLSKLFIYAHFYHSFTCNTSYCTVVPKATHIALWLPKATHIALWCLKLVYMAFNAHSNNVVTGYKKFNVTNFQMKSVIIIFITLILHRNCRYVTRSDCLGEEWTGLGLI